MSGPFRKALAAVLIMLGFSPVSKADLEAGQAAPDFRLQDQNGDWHSLEQYRGGWLALYFYPKDDTPGCTKEACGFRDNIFAFEALGASVVGISLDDVESHAEFAAKYSLPFPLLSDSGGDTAEAYGVLTRIVGMRMAKRQSFLIDPQGRIDKHYSKVNAATHSEEVLADLQARVEPATD